MIAVDAVASISPYYDRASDDRPVLGLPLPGPSFTGLREAAILSVSVWEITADRT